MTLTYSRRNHGDLITLVIVEDDGTVRTYERTDKEAFALALSLLNMTGGATALDRLNWLGS